MSAHTYRSILAAMDGEAGSDAIARTAAALAERTSAGLRRLRTTGRPADREILREARAANVDLVIVEPHAGGALSAHLLGTTADTVFRSAEVPCLVVRDPLSLPLRRIAVASDLTDAAGPALDAAIGWCRFAGSDGTDGAGVPEVRLVHVAWTVDAADHPGREDEVLRPQLERQAAEALAGTPEPWPPVRVEVVWANDPADALCGWVRKQEVDLLVVGTHGAPRIRRLLVGSVASTLARTCPCPLLVVPPAREGAGRQGTGTGPGATSP